MILFIIILIFIFKYLFLKTNKKNKFWDKQPVFKKYINN